MLLCASCICMGGMSHPVAITVASRCHHLFLVVKAYLFCHRCVICFFHAFTSICHEFYMLTFAFPHGILTVKLLSIFKANENTAFIMLPARILQTVWFFHRYFCCSVREPGQAADEWPDRTRTLFHMHSVCTEPPQGIPVLPDVLLPRLLKIRFSKAPPKSLQAYHSRTFFLSS